MPSTRPSPRVAATIAAIAVLCAIVLTVVDGRDVEPPPAGGARSDEAASPGAPTAVEPRANAGAAVGGERPGVEQTRDASSAVGNRREVDAEAAPHAFTLPVETDSGAAVDGFRIELQPRGTDVFVGRSEARLAGVVRDGQVAFRGRWGPGEYRVAVTPGSHWSLDESVDLGPAGPDPALRLSLRAAVAVHGRVVDEVGRPAANVRVRATTPGLANSCDACSEADGRFTLFSTRSMDAAVGDELVLSIVDAGDHQGQRDRSDLRWGDRDLEIVLRRPVAIPIVVRRGDSGDVMGAGYRVRLRPAGRVEDVDVTPVVTTAADGTVAATTIGGLWDGRNYLVVVPDDPALAASALLTVEVVDGDVETPIEVVLEPRRVGVVRVLEKRGVPIVGARVRVIDTNGAALWKGARRSAAEASLMPRVWRRRGPVALCEGETDANGELRFGATDRQLRDVGRIGLVVKRDNDPEKKLEDVEFGEDGAFEVRLEDSGTVTVRVVGELPEDWRWTIALSRHRFHASGDALLAAPDAREWTFPSVRTGRWHPLLVARASGPEAASEPVSEAVGIGLTAGPDVVVRSGGSQIVELDAARVRPGSARGSVAVRGGRATAVVLRRRLSPAREFGPFPLDASGRFHAKGLLPIHYELYAVVACDERNDGGAERVVAVPDGLVRVEPGATAEGSWDVLRRRLRVQIVQAQSGRAIAGLRLWILAGGTRGTYFGNYRVAARTNAGGWAEIDWAPSGKLSVSTGEDEFRSKTLGRLEVPDEATVFEDVVRATGVMLPEGVLQRRGFSRGR